jgi:hypothetical protein
MPTVRLIVILAIITSLRLRSRDDSGIETGLLIERRRRRNHLWFP